MEKRMNQARFAENLNKMLIDLRLSQADFARYIGATGSNTVATWLAGEGMPSVKFLWRMKQIFHISLDELFEGV